MCRWVRVRVRVNRVRVRVRVDEQRPGTRASASAGEELCRWRMNDEDDVSKCEIRAAW